MKLFTYREENRSRKSSFRRIQRLNTHFPFRLRSQFSCLATSKTWFQITIDKRILYQNTNCYKSKKLLVEEDEDASPTRYVKADTGRLFKHEFEALKQKTKLWIGFP